MKELVLAVFIAMMFIPSLSAQNIHLKKFFYQNPLDLNIGLVGNSYSIEDNGTVLEEGINTSINAEAGIRFPLHASYKGFSISPRIGFGAGYMKAKYYKTANIRLPLTLDFAFGAGSHFGVKNRFGIVFGAEYMYNYNSFTRIQNGSKYSPFTYSSFRFRHKNTILGITPSLAIKKDFISPTLMLSYVFIFDPKLGDYKGSIHYDIIIIEETPKPVPL